ncbi:hypothetical protein FACS1894170_05210 [Planctomycetales bacterium]|nr:hypothetical protein FACS1894170_05210 [Planctomycetales bacterium]
MSGNSPQKILNEQTLEKADLLIGVFWYRLGIPTDDYPSGSVEEYEKHVQTGKPAMLYFSTSPIPQNADIKQFRALNEFKKSVQSRVLYYEYQDEKDFENLLFNHISQIVNDKLPSLLPMENPLTDKEFESRFEKELEKHTMSSEDVDRILRETGFPTRQNK